jgi:hypothetical protein
LVPYNKDNVIYLYLQYTKDAIENVLNMVVKPKYPLVDEILVREDNDFDYTTYMIYIITDKYEALNYQNEIVKDIENVCKSMGLKRRDIENIKFASRG